MKLLFKIIFLLLFSYTQLLASTPTEEGLFRNGDNADIKGDLISYKIKLHSLVTKQQENSQPDETTLLPTPEVEEATNFIKVIVIKKGEKRFQYLFLFYSNSDFAKKHLIKVFPIYNEKNLLNDKYTELSQLNIGILQMLTLNRSDEIVNYLKSIEPNFKRNSDVINKEKSYLYARYKKYLIAIKEDPDLKEELENPRRPENEEKLEAVKKIEAMPMYLKSNAISLQQSNNKFTWTLNHPNLQASFDPKHLFLQSLFINSTNKIRVNLENFVLYDGVHQLPSSYILEMNEQEKRTVTFLSYREYMNSSVKLEEREQYYSKQLEKNMTDQEEISKDEEQVKAPFVNLLFTLK